MSDLTSRLRDLIKGTATVDARPLPARSIDPDRAEKIGRALDGRSDWHSDGSFVVVEHSYGPATRHGCRTVGDWSAQSVTAAAAVRRVLGRGSRFPLDPAACDTDIRQDAADPDGRLVFVDLETTGLAGGAGTVAFLVGLGWFENQSFQTSQLLLTDFTVERSLLGTVASKLHRASALVSFNGKAFDFPLLETRFLFQRLAEPFATIAHFDVLHPARRLWRPPDGCALADLERELFAVERRGDIPGYEIPGRYFEFVRTGDPLRLRPVLEHNRLDLMSLAGLAMRIALLVESGPEAARDARECLGLGRLYERAGERARAAGSYEQAARRSGSGDREIRTDALRRLARLHRRERRHGDAAEAWQAMLGTADRASTMEREALEGLAIYHEHRSRNLRLARHYAEQVFDGLHQHTTSAAGARHRLNRLDRKLSRTRSGLFA